MNKWIEDTITISGTIIAVVILLTVGVIMMQHQQEEIGKYCIRHPLANVTGEISYNCKDVNIRNNVSREFIEIWYK